MVQKIYLTRHGQIFFNAVYTLTGAFVNDTQYSLYNDMGEFEKGFLNQFGVVREELGEETEEKYHHDSPCPSLFNLTRRGIREAETLGNYLGNIVNEPEDIFFVTSDQQRTKDTARMIALLGGFPFVYEDPMYHHFSRNLDECTPRELARDKSNPHNQLSVLDIGIDVNAELSDVCRQNPDKDLIVVLHGHVNYCLMSYVLAHTQKIGFSESVMDNCGLRMIERDEKEIRGVGPYQSFEDTSLKLKLLGKEADPVITPRPSML